MPLTVGTAGHIDHGKTWLVRALTGKDTDRLPEEQKRGISIDLGYAPLDLPDGRRLSLIDVPGHERFVRNMVAGASGIDLFLLVVDANEGARPQTHEHLAILRLLGIDRGVVAITKADAVDEETLELAVEEARELVPGAPVVAVSAKTGAGLDELRAALADVAELVTQSYKLEQATRLYVDRVFSLRGIGTVATGTLWSGSLREGDELRAEPAGLEVRVRSVQVHDEPVAVAEAGQRVAVALPGIERNGDALSGLRHSDRLVVHLHAANAHLEPGGLGAQLVPLAQRAGPKRSRRHGSDPAEAEDPVDVQPRRLFELVTLSYKLGHVRKSRAQLVEPGARLRADRDDGRTRDELARLLDGELERLLVHRVRLRDRDDAAVDPEQAQDREVLVRLRPRALVRVHDEQEEVDAGCAGDHVAHETLVSGDVDQRQSPPVRQIERRVAQVDRDAALLLLRQPVGVLARERAHEPRLAVVDVPRGADGQRHRASIKPSPNRSARQPPRSSSSRHCASSRSRPAKSVSIKRSSHLAPSGSLPGRTTPSSRSRRESSDAAARMVRRIFVACSSSQSWRIVPRM